MPDPIEVIDAHRLLAPLGAIGGDNANRAPKTQVTNDIDASSLRRCIEAAGLSAAILVQNRPDSAKTLLSLALAARMDLVAGLVGWVALDSRDVFGKIGALREGAEGRALVGLSPSLEEATEPGWLKRREVRRGIAAVEAHGLVLHLPVGPATLIDALDTVRAFPDLHFLIRPIEAACWSRSIVARTVSPLRGFAAEWGHVWCMLPCGFDRPQDQAIETSADTDCDAVEEALAVFGPARLLYGSAHCHPRHELPDSRATAIVGETIAHLPRDDRMRILSGSARELYGLA